MQLNTKKSRSLAGLLLGAGLLGAVLLLNACGEMDDSYDEYLEGGERIYTGKVDSVKVYSGIGRVKLSWLLLADPKISYCKVFWNHGRDSLHIPVERSAGVDTIDVIVEDLGEGTHTFDIYTGDDAGHRSLKVSVTGRAYGPQYASLLPETLFTYAKWFGGETAVEWLAQEGNAIRLGVEVKYTDNASGSREVFVPSGVIRSALPDYKAGSTFMYRTLYLPDSTSIDTIFTGFITASPQAEEALDKSLFAEHVLPSDAASAWGWLLPMLWDGNTNGPNGFHTATVSMPHHYTFDLGVETRLSRFRLWQRGATNEGNFLYASGNLRRWEVWGATEPAADGSWDGWTKLLDCESFKPSGLPVGQVSDEDKAYAAEGEEFHFPPTVPPVRYIRVKVLSNWGGSNLSHSTEISFWEIVE